MVDIRKAGSGAVRPWRARTLARASATKVASFGKTPVSGWYSAVINTVASATSNKVQPMAGLTQFRLYFNLKSNNHHIADYNEVLERQLHDVTSRPQLIITYYVP